MNPLCRDCGVCCLNTEMLISKRDIERILKKIPYEINLNNFTSKLTPHSYQLKNINNCCYFFDSVEKKCKIYSFKPKGCEFYPLVYSLDKLRCEIDRECPNHSSFFTNKNNERTTCKKLKEFLKNELKVDLHY